MSTEMLSLKRHEHLNLRADGALGGKAKGNEVDVKGPTTA